MSAHPDAAGGLDPSLTAALSQELTRHARLLHVMKAQMAALVPAGLDAAAFPLLHTLVRCGPRRQGELAEQALLDPSTVSRYVGQLARAGYVERRPDPQDGRAGQLARAGYVERGPAPQDGRAVQLAATEAGTAVAHELGARRQAAVAEALGG